MLRNMMVALFVGALCSLNVWADAQDCVKFLHVGNERICMKAFRETKPSLIAKAADGTYYYASATIEEHLGRLKFKYNGYDYCVYNRDDVEYDLIHWLSGTDELVNGVWYDRLNGATLDNSPLNVTNQGCSWNEEHTGYYSADGLTQYFSSKTVPTLDFGDDWYVEVVASVGEPLGTNCWLLDLGSLTSVPSGSCGNSISLYSNGSLGTNTKPNGNVVKGAGMNVGTYAWGDKVTFKFGIKSYENNQSRAFVVWNGEQRDGVEFDTVRWDRWKYGFYLFRGVVATEGTSIFRCGPTTIYDIKIWRKK